MPDDVRAADFTKKNLTVKHTRTTYDFLTDHSQQVHQAPKPVIGQARMTDSGVKMFNPKKYENLQTNVSGAPKANYTARNFFQRSTESEQQAPQFARKVSVTKMNEILGQNAVISAATQDYYQYGPS